MTSIDIDSLTFILSLGLLTFVFAMLLTPIYTYIAFKYKLWKRPRTHSVSGEELKVIKKLRIKRTIPRMAGVVTIAAVALTTLAFNLDRQETWLPLAALAGAGVLGFADDMINIKGLGGNVAGLSPRIKLATMTLIGALGAWWIYFKLEFDVMHIPFYGDIVLGWLIIPLFIFVVISTSNAVNMSDGLDGLAGGMLINAFGAFGVIAALQGNYGIAGFCFSIVGALLAYTWFNIAPARFIMGDVGSFSLGAALGVIAMQLNAVLLLPVIGLMFVIEAASTLLQVLSKKFLGRKIFAAAPIHHHLEAGGWPKTKVTMRFWVLSQASALCGVGIAIAGGFIS